MVLPPTSDAPAARENAWSASARADARAARELRSDGFSGRGPSSGHRPREGGRAGAEMDYILTV